MQAFIIPAFFILVIIFSALFVAFVVGYLVGASHESDKWLSQSNYDNDLKWRDKAHQTWWNS